MRTAVRAVTAATLVAATTSACAAGAVDGTGSYAGAAPTPATAAAAPAAAARPDPLAVLRATDWRDYGHYLDFTTDYSPFGLTDGSLPGGGPYAMTLLRTQEYGTYAGHPVALVVVSTGEAGAPAEAVQEYLFTADEHGTVRMLAGSATPLATQGASMAESDFWCHGAFRLTPSGIGEFHNDCAQGYQGPYLGRTLVLGQPLDGPNVPDVARGVLRLEPLGAAVPISGNPPHAEDGSLITWNGRGATVDSPNPDVSAPDGA